MADPADSQPRPKRQKTDKHGRLAAFDRLKNLKGLKNKCTISEVDNVFETVDEREYCKTISSKYEDWIVEDGSGYVEDGRDIFDDDLDEQSIAQSLRNVQPKKRKNISDNAGKGSIQSLLSKTSSKKEKEISLEDDAVLTELISEIDDISGPSTVESKPQLSFCKLKEAQDYMSGFAVKQKETVEFDASKDAESDKNINVPNEICPENKEPSKLLFNIEPPNKTNKDEQNAVIETDLIDKNDDIFDDDFSQEQLNDLDIALDWNSMHKIEGSAVESQNDADFSNIVDVGDDTFRFFWWDAYEDVHVQPGVVFLFGKTLEKKSKQYVSCSLIVRNISRKIFILPRANNLSNDKPVSILDVYEEFKEKIAVEYKINEFKSKKVEKKYAFDPDVPLQSEFLEIRYSAKENRLPSDLSGDTFSRIFGTDTSYLELLLLDARIRGPCWLDVNRFTVATNPITYCTSEVHCDYETNAPVVSMQSNLPPPPPLTIATIYLQPATDAKGHNEIALVSVLVQSRYRVECKKPQPMFDEHFCIMSVPSSTIAPSELFTNLQKYKSTRVQKVNNEKALLNYFLLQIARIDPDVIVGYDLQGYQFNILAERLRTLDIQRYCRLSRIKRSANAKSRDNKSDRCLTTGRLICDIKVSAKELIRVRSYDLDQLCQCVLKVKEGARTQIDATDVRKMYANCADLLTMISLHMQDTAYILNIMYELNVIPLALQITNIAGNVMSRTLMGGRSERNEFLLLHAFTEKNYIVPDKRWKRAQSKRAESTNPSRKKPTYAGGLVLDPKIGFYNDLVLLMDFNSLYPSIIQEFNICFTTVSTNEGLDTYSRDSSVATGILPTEIRKLVESRKQVKGLMKNLDVGGDLAMQYHIRQMALKLTANSMYGCLGFANSRFYAKNLAELITLKGREILTRTKELAEKCGFDVIYGDTDSIMINTHVRDYDQVMKIGYKIKNEVNKLYKHVELDIDGVFKYLLLLKKKKYAALLLTKDKNGQIRSSQEHKGLDIVRRDCAQIAVEAGRFVLSHILSEGVQTTEELAENIHTHLRKLADDMRNGRVPLSLLVITKQLTKNPSLYTNSTALSHVTVAKRCNSKSGRKFSAGDTISYVICQDGTDLPPTQRAYHVDEYRRASINADNSIPSTTAENASLKIDAHYYLAQQVHPVISRLCDPIDGTSAEQLADCLGLDIRGLGRSGDRNTKDARERLGVNFKDPAIKYRGAKAFEFSCPTCGYANSVSAPIVNGVPALDRCANADCTARPLLNNDKYIHNKLLLDVRAYTKRYYRHELQCEDPLCTQLTSAVPAAFHRRMPICVFCAEGVMVPLYSARDLHTQLRFYEYLMDVTQWATKPVMEKHMENQYEMLRGAVTDVLHKSAYSFVSLSYIAHIVRKPETLSPSKPNADELDLIEVDYEDECQSGDDVYY